MGRLQGHWSLFCTDTPALSLSGCRMFSGRLVLSASSAPNLFLSRLEKHNLQQACSVSINYDHWVCLAYNFARKLPFGILRLSFVFLFCDLAS